MIKITIEVDALPEQVQGIKEDLAVHLERWGDTRVVKVLVPGYDQTSLFAKPGPFWRCC